MPQRPDNPNQQQALARLNRAMDSFASSAALAMMLSDADTINDLMSSARTLAQSLRNNQKVLSAKLSQDIAQLNAKTQNDPTVKAIRFLMSDIDQSAQDHAAQALVDQMANRLTALADSMSSVPGERPYDPDKLRGTIDQLELFMMLVKEK